MSKYRQKLIKEGEKLIQPIYSAFKQNRTTKLLNIKSYKNKLNNYPKTH